MYQIEQPQYRSNIDLLHVLSEVLNLKVSQFINTFYYSASYREASFLSYKTVRLSQKFKEELCSRFTLLIETRHTIEQIEQPQYSSNIDLLHVLSEDLYLKVSQSINTFYYSASYREASFLGYKIVRLSQKFKEELCFRFTFHIKTRHTTEERSSVSISIVIPLVEKLRF